MSRSTKACLYPKRVGVPKRVSTRKEWEYQSVSLPEKSKCTKACLYPKRVRVPKRVSTRKE
eukprot:3580645-Pleurochrysis_carterae.AAC.2